MSTPAGPIDDTAVAAAQGAVRSVRARIERLGDDGLDLLFREARSHNGWQARDIGDDQLRALFEIVKFGPTSANANPMRLRFLRSAAAKARLEPALAPNNVAKAQAAPVVAVVGHDLRFFEHLPRLFPHKEMAGPFAADPARAEVAAFRNGSLQGAYLMLGARALGLDVGAMSGFDNAKVDQAFFAGTSVRSNFLCCLGYGDESKLFQRLPRFDFDEVCQIM